MSVASCISWVPTGYAKSIPDKVKLTDDDMKKIFSEEHENKKDEVADDDNDIVKNSDPEDIGLYNLDDYDNEESNDDKEEDFVKLSNLATFHSNKLDNYITNQSESDMDSDEMEDWKIKESDNLLACGVINDCEGSLEIHVYNRSEESFYVHHDIMLPYLPISCEWLSYDSANTLNESTYSEKGNFLAVGGMKSIIDIWDLDIVDSVQPYYTLKHKGEKDKGVLGLSWNKAAQKVLASSVASGYTTTWDLSIASKLQNFPCHSDKVGTLAWHPEESNLLLSGSSDKSCVLLDCRVEFGESSSPSSFDSYRCALGNEVETVAWHTDSPYQFLVGSNDGLVTCFDCRKRTDKVYEFKAYDDATEGLSMCLQYPYLLTCSANDPYAKLWDLASSPIPRFLNRKKICLKQIHSVQLLPRENGSDPSDGPLVAAFAGIGSSKPIIGKMDVTPATTSASIPSGTSSDIMGKIVLESQLKKNKTSQAQGTTASAKPKRKVKPKAPSPRMPRTKEGKRPRRPLPNPRKKLKK